MTLRSSTFGLATALTLLLAQTSTLIHLALVEHQRCPEHGETVHRGSAPVAGLGAVADLRGAVLDGPSAADLEERDEHCLGAALTQAALELPRPSVTPATPPVEIRPYALRIAPSPSLPLLDLAPKHGPPEPIA
jgi:hypothetical protein